MKLRVFGSGSGGNCMAVRSAGGALLLVDCGLSCRELERRAKACGVNADDVVGILFTHDHHDHYAGLATFHKRHPSAALFANGDTADSIAAKTGVDDGWATFETGVPFSAFGFSVSPFSTSHDAADPVGYLISDSVSAFFVGTDTGIVTAGMRDAFTRADCAVLESNHDPILLEQSLRPVSLKQRIRGRSGHLANADAAALVRETNPARLKTLLLAHLSEECNSRPLALDLMRETLSDLSRLDVALAALEQDVPSELFEF